MKNCLEYKGDKVEKFFRSAVSFEKEKAVYEIMSGSGFVPQVYGYGEKSILMERLPGEKLADAIWQPDLRLMLANAKSRATAFCDFQKYYYEKTGVYLVNRDSNLKNFIINGDSVKLIDFENSFGGAATEAAGEFLAAYVSENDMLYECFEVVCDVIEKQLPRADIHRAGVIARAGFVKARRRRSLMPAIRRSALCIAAGGGSVRMGRAKGLLPFKNHTICHWIIYNLSVFDNMFISANLPRYNSYGLPVYGDKQRDKGPLSAIYTALTQSDCRWVMICRCDMPFVTEDVALTLFENITPQAQAVIITDGEKPCPILGLYHKSALPAVKKRLDSGNYRLRLLLDDINTVYVKYKDKERLRNINTKEEYKAVVGQAEKISLC